MRYVQIWHNPIQYVFIDWPMWIAAVVLLVVFTIAVGILRMRNTKKEENIGYRLSNHTG